MGFGGGLLWFPVVSILGCGKLTWKLDGFIDASIARLQYAVICSV
jgi:hypothetical protein